MHRPSADGVSSAADSCPETVNIAATLRDSALKFPTQQAVIFPAGRDSAGRVTYSQLTFAQLDDESNRLASGLRKLGVRPGHRLVLMVRPSLEFIALTYALFKAGAVAVLIDPGMGPRNIFRCLDTVEPEGFVAISAVQALRLLNPGRFPSARWNVTVGRRWFWGGPTYKSLLGSATNGFQMVATAATDPAAIIFTTGSTGPAKGVVYEHGMFAAQVEQIRSHYQIQPGEIDLPGFPLFALFNAAMGVTTVIPDMDPTRPAKVDPVKILEGVDNQGVTQAFGSPAIWNRVGSYCVEQQRTLGTLKRVLSAGAPVPIPVLRSMQQSLAEGGTLCTPYGATEALPVCSISAEEVLTRTAARTEQGAGTCVGHPFPGIQVRIIEISDQPLEHWSDVRELPMGQIGEITVSGPVVTREYFRLPAATKLAKIADGERFWHRMGDVGYFDEEGALWYCGRKAHIVETADGRMFTDCCEAVFNTHPRVFRSALVGVGDKPAQTPVMIVEPHAGRMPRTASDRLQFFAELEQLAATTEITRSIRTFLLHPAFPVDIRHNIKIFREKLAPWAARQLNNAAGLPSSSKTKLPEPR